MYPNIFITLDYELYFGACSGSQNRSIIYPTCKLLEVLNKHNVTASFFVDSGYIVKLKEFKEHYSIINEDYNQLSKQLLHLVNQGHDLQLHIHPHWEDSYFDGQRWIMD